MVSMLWILPSKLLGKCVVRGMEKEGRREEECKECDGVNGVVFFVLTLGP